ncbi:MAG: DUF1152 domain-containing protein [Myxococcales bacterium]|nr:DUF1152 domain-containing protein [Myxococcales bacterium]
MDERGASLAHLPIFERLSNAQNVLIAGAGGGFDVFAGLPLALALRSQGKRVRFANLSFTYLGGTNATRLDRVLYEVRPNTRGEDKYFPERALAQWLEARGEDASVFALEKVGVRPMREAYARLAEWFALDAVVLVDGGTDILMRGDEAGLGTPAEDMVSLSAAAALSVPTKLVACLGFGIDAFHGVSHGNFLENVAELTTEGGFLGAFSLLPSMAEGRAFLDAVSFAQSRTPGRPSIVNGSIAAALEGRFGDVQFTERTSGSELFINPLMSMYWAFELDAIARRSLYLPLLEDTEDIFDVSARIEAFRRSVKRRPRVAIPH